MKRLSAFILLSVLFSCSNNDSIITPTKLTVANKYTEIRSVIYRNSDDVLLSDSGFVKNGNKVFYSNNAGDCGKIIPGSEHSQNEIRNGVSCYVFTFIRYEVLCE